MNLLLTSAERLRAFYGRQGAQQVLDAIDHLIDARARRGATSRLVLIEAGAPDLSVPRALVNPDAIARQLGALEAALAKQGQRLASVLLVGGPEIVQQTP